MPLDLTEQELVSRVAAGDPDGLGELYKRFYNCIYAGAYRIFKNREDAEDIAHDTFLRICEKIAGFRGESSLSSWVYRMATGLAIDELRRRKGVESIDAYNEDQHPQAPPFDPVPGIALDQALQQIPRRDRFFFRKQKVEGLSQHEVAAETGTSWRIVNNQYTQTRKRLREILGPKR